MLYGCSGKRLNAPLIKLLPTPSPSHNTYMYAQGVLSRLKKCAHYSGVGHSTVTLYGSVLCIDLQIMMQLLIFVCLWMAIDRVYTIIQQ